MNGFGDGLARAFELAVTPAVFGFLGYLLDRALGSVPVFTIGLLLFALAGMFVRMWFTYDAQMREIEAKGSWTRRAAPAVREPGSQ